MIRLNIYLSKILFLSPFVICVYDMVVNKLCRILQHMVINIQMIYGWDMMFALDTFSKVFFTLLDIYANRILEILQQFGQ